MAADCVQGMGYGATFSVYNYNARGELETTKRYRGDTATTSPSASDELPGQRFEYRFDSIGNRKSSGSTGTASDDQYFSNSANQYTDRDNKTVKAIGTASADSTVAVAGAVSTGKKDRIWGADIVPNNSGGPAQGTATVYAAKPGGAELIRTDSSRTWFMPKLSQHLDYDADGNLTGDGVWSYTYNAENQLVRMTSLLPAGFTGRRLRLDFKYDYLGRRVEKRVYDNDSSTETVAKRYVYDGWNLIAETTLGGSLSRTFTWGLDLVGSLSASGGVGALLQINDLDAGKTLYATYDGNGNVASLVNASGGAIEAAYEYDPSGNLLRSEGTYAKSNPFRFSTKWQDNETGLLNYGFRYYSPTMGRFINRDPIGEKGGLNLYGFCGNNGVGRWDYLGMVMQDIYVSAPGDDEFDRTTGVIRGTRFDSGSTTVVSGASNWGVGGWVVGQRARNQAFAQALLEGGISGIAAANAAWTAAAASAIEKAYALLSMGSSVSPTVSPNVPGSTLTLSVSLGAGNATGVPRGPMYDTYHPGDTYNADGSVNPGGDSYFDFGPALARIAAYRAQVAPNRTPGQDPDIGPDGVRYVGPMLSPDRGRAASDALLLGNTVTGVNGTLVYGASKATRDIVAKEILEHINGRIGTVGVVLAFATIIHEGPTVLNSLDLGFAGASLIPTPWTEVPAAIWTVGRVTYDLTHLPPPPEPQTYRPPPDPNAPSPRYR